MTVDPIRTLLPGLVLAALVFSGVSAGTTMAADVPTPDEAATGQVVPPTTTSVVRNQLGFAFPEAPAVPDGPADESLVATLDAVFSELPSGVPIEAVREIVDSGDARAAWLFSDLARFLGPGPLRDELLAGFEQLTGNTLADDPVAIRSPWQSMTDHLIAWDLPALDGYEDWKAQLFTLVDPRWGAFFEDTDADIDWRLVSWGGVLMDDRPFGDTGSCELGCIPALDDPAVTDAAGGDWYPDEALVFGVTVNGESRAYPKNIMEIHEMVNDELGGRRLALPYCTLCGSAQAYFTDDVAGSEQMPVLRTSGLLSRSNKVMFDLATSSVFDTFSGLALSGPLREAGVELEQGSVVTSTWGDWKAAHPDTTIVAEDGGVGRSYSLDPLRGRDDDGAIFPIGAVDERLPTQEKVLGVFTDDGTAIAFPVAEARAELDAGRPVAALGIVVVPDASGVRATREDGTEIVSHEAFWFAWSQFYPDTVVWVANDLRASLTPLQYRVTQEDGTEPPFDNTYWDEKRAGIYVDVVSGEPLFSSTDKFQSGTGWPSFTRPIDPDNIIENEDLKLSLPRTEVRSTEGDSHLGHLFADGPEPTGQRYCINSAALRFIPEEDLEREGYGEYVSLFE